MVQEVCPCAQTYSSEMLRSKDNLLEYFACLWGQDIRLSEL